MRKYVCVLFIFCAVLLFQAGSVSAYTGFAKKGIQPEEYLQRDDLCPVEFVYSTEFDTVDFSNVTLTLFNNKDNNYYDVIMENVGQDDYATMLPAGSYELYCAYYDGRTNLNYNTELNPCTFELNENGVGSDTDGYVYVYTGIQMQSVYTNTYTPKIVVCGEEEYDGTVELVLKGQSYADKNKEETYEICINNVNTDESVELKAGEYHIEKIKAVDAQGNEWGVCYDDNVTHINFNKGTERTFLLYRNVSDIPSEYAGKVLDDDMDWTLYNKEDISILQAQEENETVRSAQQTMETENEIAKEEEIPEAAVHETETETEQKLVNTGKKTLLFIYILLVFAAILGLSYFGFMKKRK